MTDIRQSIGLPPTETVAFFRAKGLHTQIRWDETWQEEHARSFTVSKILDLQLLGQVRASLDKVLSQGGTFEQWKKDLLPQLKSAGWYGRVDKPDLTGSDKAIIVGDRRLRTIYDTNLRMARAAGKWSRIQELKKRAPYLMYDAVNDGRARPLHRLWGGLDNGQPVVLHVDDPWWNTHFPPCGWGCRCGVIQLSERDIKRQRLMIGHNGGPPLDERPWRRSDGTIHMVPAGIDPGFAYNPGSASLAGLARHASDTLAQAAQTNLRGARAILSDLVDSPVLEHFLRDPQAEFPVMLLDAALKDVIKAKTPVVVLSAADARKQAARHPDVPIEAYRDLPRLGAAPTIVARDRARDTHFYFLAPRGEGWMVAIVKRTVSGEAVFLNSYRLQNDESLVRLLRDAVILIDGRN